MPALSRCACALTPEGAASRVQAHARDLQELSMRGRVSRGAVFESDGCRETCVTSTAYDACRTNCRAVQLATRISMDWCTLAVGVPNLSDATEGNTPHARLFRASSFFGSQGFWFGTELGFAGSGRKGCWLGGDSILRVSVSFLERVRDVCSNVCSCRYVVCQDACNVCTVCHVRHVCVVCLVCPVCLGLPLSLFVCLCTSLSIWLAGWLPACPCACLCVRPSVLPSVRLSVCLPVCRSARVHAHIGTSIAHEVNSEAWWWEILRLGRK